MDRRSSINKKTDENNHRFMLYKEVFSYLVYSTT
ncbi:hypothetical protein J2781_001691 [Chryseobacterium geocarposphaerae]|uniref:Uncharacterized protein n=1 Tax=Chryseobacterium geocarposphaerae TaxID=1416776 RepID=A0ABU1LDG8_9FLAO|nr:hypothetical protein [Chryseobacterium geocarposphaerae]